MDVLQEVSGVIHGTLVFALVCALGRMGGSLAEMRTSEHVDVQLECSRNDFPATFVCSVQLAMHRGRLGVFFWIRWLCNLPACFALGASSIATPASLLGFQTPAAPRFATTARFRASR